MSQQKRTMDGNFDFSNEVSGTLRVGAMVSRRPLPRYETTCTRCGAQSFVGQKELVQGNAICKNSDCGRQQLREELEDTPRKYAQRLQRIEQQKFDALANQVKDTASKIALLQRDQIAKGVDSDYWDLRRIDPECCEISMTAAQADQYNREAYRLWAAETPGWYATPDNLSVFQGYLERQGSAGIVSKAMLTAAFKRLDSFGLLAHAPAPQPARQTQAQPRVTPRADARPAPAQPKRDEPEEGWDLRTGEKRLFSAFEIRHMDADTYKRTFRLYGDRAPRTPMHAAF